MREKNYHPTPQVCHRNVSEILNKTPLTPAKQVFHFHEHPFQSLFGVLALLINFCKNCPWLSVKLFPLRRQEPREPHQTEWASLTEKNKYEVMEVRWANGALKASSPQYARHIVTYSILGGGLPESIKFL